MVMFGSYACSTLSYDYILSIVHSKSLCLHLTECYQSSERAAYSILNYMCGNLG